MNYKIKKLKNKIAYIHLEGRLIAEFQTVSITDELDALLEENYRNLIFDLSGLEYMSSSGLGFFLKWLTKMRKHDGEVVLCSLNNMLKSLLVTTKLVSFFAICENKDDALVYLEKEKSH